MVRSTIPSLLLGFILLGFFSLHAHGQEDFDPALYFQSYYNEIPDSIICDLILDSLDSRSLEDMSANYYTVELLYAEDSSICVLQIEVESCGAYCNPFWTSYFILFNKDGWIDAYFEDDFNCNMAVEEIHLLSQGRILLIGSTYGRPRSVESTWGQRAIIAHFDTQLNVLWSQNAITSNAVERSDPIAQLKYVESLGLLEYGFDWYEEDPYSCYRTEGVWDLSIYFPKQISENRMPLDD